jgi:hypothetical protein
MIGDYFMTIFNSKVFAVSLLTITALFAGFKLAEGNYVVAAVNALCAVYWIVKLIRENNTVVVKVKVD